MAFDLSDLLKDVSKSGTDLEQIEYIPLDLIDPDPDNFYSLSGLNELADSIATIGLQQPLRVRTGENGHVTCISGHRRRGAIMLIRDGGSDQFAAGVPCIRERGQDSAALSELKLIFANSATREMTSAEKSKQAERVEALLYQLKEEGYDFPGRMRDHVAHACNVSKSKLARLKVIRDNLDHQFKTQYEEGKLSEQAAYAISRLPKDVRDTLALAVPKKIIDGYAAERVLDQYKDGFGTVPECPKGGKCSNCAGHLRRVATSNSWEHQCTIDECCIKCNNRNTCKGVCVYGSILNQKEQAKEAKDKEKRELEDKKRKDGYRQQTIDNAKRLLKAIEAAGLADSVHLDWGTFASNMCATVHNVKDTAAGRIKKDAYFYRADCDVATSGSSALRLAKQLGCSADYLLGLTDELTPTPAEPAAPKWRSGKPDKTGEYLCKHTCGADVYWFNADTESYYPWKGCSEPEVDVLGWYPIPED